MRAVLWTVLILLVLMAVFAAWASRPAIHPIESPAASAFEPAEVARGANLAMIGNCNVCHTAPDGGRAFAGGRAVGTPFGIIYSTNITPDLRTGIGQWSEPAFRRALRDGVDREGDHLYPAFPYDHFTLLTDADSRALYAYFMTREPVRATVPDNAVPFPLNMRHLLAAWKALFFRARRFQPDARHDAMWNRGAYLVEGVGHCGACHTPRNSLGAEKKQQRLAGGEVEGWNAYALDRDSPAPVPWDAESLFNYLRRGWHGRHGVARGPMSDVTMNLARADAADVRAIATYIAWQMRDARAAAATRGGTRSAPAPSGETRAARAPSGETRMTSGVPGAAGESPDASPATGASSRTPPSSGATGPSSHEAPAARAPHSEGSPQAAVHDAESARGNSPAAISATPDSPHQLGAAIYASTCATCHNGTRPLPYGGINFTLSTAINAPNPRNIINVTLHGLHAPEGERGSIMPGFAAALDDDQLEALLGYLRAEFSGQPPWPDAAADIDAARKAEHREGDSWP